MKTEDHLKGLRVPSLESAVREAVRMLGSGKLDLALNADRERLIRALVQCMAVTFAGELTRAFTDACAKACEHVGALMEDADYQAKRAARRRQSAERRKQRIADDAERTRVAREAARQERKGLVQ